MAVPKKRVSRTRRDKRRANDRHLPKSLSVCPECRERKLPHRVCPYCGTYKGRQVVEVEIY